MDKGVILVGEAAQQFIEFKYFELYWNTGIVLIVIINLMVFLYLLAKRWS